MKFEFRFAPKDFSSRLLTLCALKVGNNFLYEMKISIHCINVEIFCLKESYEKSDSYVCRNESCKKFLHKSSISFFSPKLPELTNFVKSIVLIFNLHTRKCLDSSLSKVILRILSSRLNQSFTQLTLLFLEIKTDLDLKQFKPDPEI